MGYNKKLILLSSFLGMLIFGIVMTTIGSTLPETIKKFNLTESDIGTLVSLLPAGILIGSILFGPIIDSFGYKFLFISANFIAFLSLFTLGTSEALIILQGSVLLIGISGGILNGLTNALVSDISEEDRGSNLSILGVFYGVGALGMPFILGLLSKSFGTNKILQFISLFILLISLIFLFIKFPLPKNPISAPLKNSFKLIVNPVLLLFGFTLFFQSGIEGIINNWSVTFLIQHKTFTNETALFSLSLFVVGLTISRLILGFLLRKFGFRYILYISFVISYIALLILFTNQNTTILILGMILLGFGVASVFPIIFSIVGELFKNSVGTAFSIILVIALVGNILINYLVGIVGAKFLIFVLFSASILMNLIFFISDKYSVTKFRR